LRAWVSLFIILNSLIDLFQTAEFAGGAEFTGNAGFSNSKEFAGGAGLNDSAEFTGNAGFVDSLRKFKMESLKRNAN